MQTSFDHQASLAIKCQDLGKSYRLGESGHHTNLREILAEMARVPFDRMRLGNGKGNGRGRNGHEIIWALKDVNLEIARGEVVGIVGKNGAGKSTLLKILSRVTKPTKGTASIYGSLGSLLEVGTGFHHELTGRENIYLNGSVLGMTKEAIEARFEAIVRFAGIEKFLDTPLKRYSSGMYVRLAFAIAVHVEPDILLLDEILAVGDPAFQKSCLDKIRHYADGGGTVVFVSHNLDHLAALCRRVVWMKNGEVVAEGDSRDVITAFRASSALFPIH